MHLENVLVNQRRNALSLVCSSPPEILQYIFRLFADEESDRQTHYRPRKGRTLPTVVPSYVCTRWRRICLNDGYLWATLSLDWSGRWPFEFVARSGNWPLQVSLSLSETSISEKEHTVTRHINRIRALHVDFARGRMGVPRAFCDSILNQPAPLLESLSLSHAPQPSSGIITLSSTIFSSIAPRLRSLSLTLVRLPDSMIPAFSHLKTVETRGSLTTEAAVCLLRTTPSLKVLICNPLIYQFGVELDPSSSGSERINAPQLTTLVMKNVKSAELIQVLEALEAPSLSQIVVSDIIDSSLIQSNHDHLDDIATSLPMALSSHIKVLRRLHGPIQELIVNVSSVTCWPSRSALHLYGDTDDIDDTYAFYINYWMVNFNSFDDAQPLFDGLLRVLPVDEVHTLSLHDIVWPYPSLYRIANTTELRYTSIKSLSDTPYLLQAMIPLEQRIGVGERILPQSQILFPRLAKIVFKDAKVPADGEKLVCVLQCLAQARRRDGITLEVAFEGCNYRAGVMAGLKDVNVTWNGTWCPPFSFGGLGEDPQLENWEMWGSLFDQP
ncbi:hypothetical protein EVG20_g466 [Dentipellis fragilis]|uniref:Uncharacterized protein n=1 Tax=Dentipellis fragilis TaxID=205917 RepID=A0A4Y9ZGH9_9AGAM|nr:hypothetical protein EVG20_g466 [Dentipellis fragilis]